MNDDEKINVIKRSMPQTYEAIKKKAEEIGPVAYSLVRRGLRGEAGCFWAMEAGHVMGTPFGQSVDKEIAYYMVQFGCAHVCIFAKINEVKA